MKQRALKRIAAAFLALALLTAGQGLAAGTNTFSCGDAMTASPGGEVLFPIYVSGGASIAACRLYILCDTDVVTLKQNQSGDYQVQAGDMTKQGSWGANTYGNAGWQISWYRERNTQMDGVLCYLPLKIAADAPLGTYEVTLLCSAENTVDEDGNEVPFVTVNGSIEITSPDPAIYTKGQELTPGETIDLPIYLRNNPGLMGLHLQFESNEQVEIVLGENGLPIVTQGELLSAGTFLVNAYGNRGGQIIWFNAMSIQEDGLLCTIRLRISETVESPVLFPLVYNASNTLNSGNKPQSLLLDGPFTALPIAPPFSARWSPDGKTLHMGGTLTLPAELDKNNAIGLLALYRNGKLLQISTGVSLEPDAVLTMAWSIPAPTEGDMDRLNFYILDATTLAPLQGRTDISMK